jgi:hypothetical protein
MGRAAAALVMGTGVGPVHFAAVVRNLETLPDQEEIISEVLRRFRQRLALHSVGKSRAPIFVPGRCPHTVAVCTRDVIDTIDAIALPRDRPFVVPVERPQVSVPSTLAVGLTGKENDGGLATLAMVARSFERVKDR